MNTKQEERMFSRVHQDIGQASMCWDKTPTGIFDSSQAREIALKLCQFIAQEIKESEKESK